MKLNQFADWTDTEYENLLQLNPIAPSYDDNRLRRNLEETKIGDESKGEDMMHHTYHNDYKINR